MKGWCRASTAGDAVLQQARLDGEREDLLRLRLLDRMAADRRPDRRRRSRRASSIRKYIVIWACNSISTNLHHWPFVLEAQKRGAKVVVIDSYTLAHRQAGRLAHHAEARHRRRARHGRHRRDDRATALSTADCVDKHTVGFDELSRARARSSRPTMSSSVTGVPAADIARFAHEFATSAAFRHPHGRRARAARRRRADHPRRVRHPGARRLMASCRRRTVADAAVGVPGRLGARVAARLHQAGHARGQQPPARPGARPAR